MDLFIGGHSHSLLLPPDDPRFAEAEGPYPTIVADKAGKKRHVVTARCYTMYAGVLKVCWEVTAATKLL